MRVSSGPLLLSCKLFVVALVLLGCEEDFENALNSRIDALHITQASTALFSANGVEFTSTYGKTEESTIFQVASLTKNVTAIAVLQLVDNNQLDLAQQVTDHGYVWHFTGYNYDGEPLISNVGGTSGVRTNVFLSPKNDVGFVFLASGEFDSPFAFYDLVTLHRSTWAMMQRPSLSPACA